MHDARLLLLAVSITLAAGCAAADSGRPEPDGLTAARLRVLEPALHHEQAAMRRRTVAAVGAQGVVAGDLLLEGLAAESAPAVRQQYVRELRRAPGEDVRSALAAVAGDDAEAAGVRLTAVQSLAALEAATELAQLADGDDAVARSARLALMAAGGEPARAWFRAAAVRTGVGPALRRELVCGFCRLAQPADVELVRAFTEHDDAAVRRGAVRALGRLGDPGDRPRLAARALRDADRSVRRAARVALFRCRARQ